MLEYSANMTWEDIYRFGAERKFSHTEVLWLMGEFERNELIRQEAVFRVDQTRPTLLRLYIRRRYITIDILPYTILERIVELMLRLTFSIETGKGHEPFECEVTCESILPTTDEAQRGYYLRRIVNAVIKYFWVVFDSFKDIRPAKGIAEGSPMERALKWAIWLQKYADPIEEENVDMFLELMMKLGAFQRDLDEYVTHEAVITIGVEYEATIRTQPAYPNVDVYIEKTRVRRFHLKRRLIVADTTDINILEILDIELSI